MRVLLGERRSHLGIILLLVVGLGSAPALAADDAAAGRHHAAKGHRLASKNNCTGAIAAFSRAYSLIRDPVLLFNRAECYRKLGKNQEAVKDYEQFLAELPNAPNRSSVEARLVVLRGAASRDTKPATPPAPEAVPPEKSPAKGKPAAAEPSQAEKWTD